MADGEPGVACVSVETREEDVRNEEENEGNTFARRGWRRAGGGVAEKRQKGKRARIQ